MDAQDQTQSQAPAPTQEAAPPQVAPQVQEAAPPSPDLVALQAKLAQYEAQLQEKESAWSQERELLRSGVLDAEAQEVAQHFYAKIPAPKEGTKPTISQWLANRDALPKAVAAYLPQAQAPQVQQVHTPQAGAAPQAAPAPVRLPDSDRGAGAAPQASSSFSPTAIKSLTPQEYAASRAAILASLGKR